MTAEQRWRLWRQYVREVLRPEEARARPSRGALVADLVLALLLTVLAVAAVADLRDGSTEGRPGPAAVSLRLRPDPPARPVSPDPPSPRAGSEQGPHPLLVVLTALPLAVRRRYPLAVFWTVVLAALATHEAVTWITVLACAVAAYGALAYSRHRLAAAGGLAAAAVLTGVVFQDVVPTLPPWLGPIVVLTGAGVLAVAVRFWQGRLRAGRDHIDALRRAQATAMRAAVDEERARIAAELHDIVTHNVSVMVIQAGAARKVMDAEPAESKRALLAIEAGGRAAMSELRHVMGLLATENETMRHGATKNEVTENGPPDPQGGLAPQPGLDQLDALVTRVRAAGIRVGVELSLPPGPLPAGVDLAAYRVVQEALTNTIKHAAGAAASVSIRHEGDRLEIEVTDTGGTRRGPSYMGGRGLIGLRERLAVYGGTLEAGPTPAGGYRILARVPWLAS
ncbi:histidine kinase [Nonomuraea sp. NPDC049504]|uniref:sensor histidine kinase n=1 Tax=Nonomuraea sp. NPDC049504 TaxID=3154729 RepID=UPI00341D3375